MININDILNNNTINIFTDASTLKSNNITYSGYGAITMLEYREIGSKVFVDANSTSNIGELKAIRTGISEAISLRQQGFTGTINLFSDSQYSILSLRDWIFNWRLNPDGTKILGYGNKPVSNQSLILEIIQILVQFNPNVFLYHQKGHVNINKKKDIYKASNVFSRSNYIKDEIDIELIKFISTCNNEIDNRTRWHLRNQAILKPYQDPFTFIVPDNYIEQLHQYNIIRGGRFYV